MKHMTSQMPQHGQFDRETGLVFDANNGKWYPAAHFYAKYQIPTYTDADTRMSHWKIFGIVAAVLGVLLLAVLITSLATGGESTNPASQYSTTEQAYLDAIHELNLSHTSGDAGFLADGERICEALDEGYSEYAVAGEMQQNSVNEQGEAGISRSQAASIVDVTNRILCSTGA